jgi:DNA-binding transcriptional MerR regulator
MGKYTVSDLISASGLTAPGIHYYVKRGILPRPLSRGRGLIYDDVHLIRLRAACRLRAQHVPLDDIRARLDRATTEELRALGAPLVGLIPAPGTEAAAPGAGGARAAEGAALPSGASSAGASSTGASSAGASSAGASASCPTHRWEHIELLPGLELHVRLDGGPVLARLAEEIQARYGLRR